MMAAVLQLSVVRTILFFVNLVLWTDEQYDYGDVSDSHSPLRLYVTLITPQPELLLVNIKNRLMWCRLPCPPGGFRQPQSVREWYHLCLHFFVLLRPPAVLQNH